VVISTSAPKAAPHDVPVLRKPIDVEILCELVRRTFGCADRTVISSPVSGDRVTKVRWPPAADTLTGAERATHTSTTPIPGEPSQLDHTFCLAARR
jgi:hypothetical protein